MKYFFALLFLLLSANVVSAQEYLDKVGERSCQCVDKIPKDLSKNAFTAQLGICVFQSFSKEDKAQFKKDFGLDVNNPLQDGEKIGQKVGMNMLSQCPATLAKIGAMNDQPSGIATGTVTKIENDNFVVFSVNDNTGKSSKFVWLYSVQSPPDFQNNYQDLIGKKVELHFDIKEMFDPKIGEYRQFKVLTGVKPV